MNKGDEAADNDETKPVRVENGDGRESDEEAKAEDTAVVDVEVAPQPEAAAAEEVEAAVEEEGAHAERPVSPEEIPVAKKGSPPVRKSQSALPPPDHHD